VSVEAIYEELKFTFNLRCGILCIIPVSGFHNELCGLVLHVLLRETQHAIHSDLLLPTQAYTITNRGGYSVTPQTQTWWNRHPLHCIYGKCTVLLSGPFQCLASCNRSGFKTSPFTVSTKLETSIESAKVKVKLPSA